MIVCKYSKTGKAAFLPHLDVMRHFAMAIRRRKLDIRYSEGYNPHMLIFMSQPLPLGAESECEYFAAASGEFPQRFKDELNAGLPEGLRVVNSAFSQRAGVACDGAAARWKIDFPLSADILKRVLKSPEYVITYEDKGKKIEREVRDKIYDLSSDEKSCVFTLGYGNNNLRADRLFSFLAEKDGIGNPNFCIKKIEMFTDSGGRLIPLDEVYFGGEAEK